MTPNPVEVISVFGEYGGLLGLTMAAFIGIILCNMILGYKRQNRFDDRMLEAVNHSTQAMNNLASVIGRLPCTAVRDPSERTRSTDVYSNPK